MKLFNFLNKINDEKTLNKLAFLSTTKLFKDIPRRQLIFILENLKERVYLKGETVFTEGDIGRALFVVSSGRISLNKENEDHTQYAVAEIRPGEYFGEMALLEEMPRTTTAVAAEDTHVFMLFKIDLEHLLRSRPLIGVIISTQLAKILSTRLRELLERPK